MSTEELREASALMRERAEAASPGPWVQHTAALEADTAVFDGIGNWVTNVDNCANTAERAIIGGESVCSDQAVPNGEHIASWHPAVALAVADWLEREADEHERHVARSIKITSIRTAYADDRARHALAVARAYLGSTS